MSKSLFFYDLETSGFKTNEHRIMQFAGQRTDLNLNKLGKPFNILIKLTEDVLPDPEAILLTGITPQKTIDEGISEAEFLKLFTAEISTPDTIFVGFNTIRFDDEFMRYIHYRNFYDPYEWQWLNGRGKWDLLDVVRMTRALRPDGIVWPIEQGKAVNKLGSLTKANNISHDGAHDALSDVNALLELSQLLLSKQPKLFKFLMDIMGNKKKIGELINSLNPIVYTSGKYPSSNEKTTVVSKLVDHPSRAGSLVFDLRYNPRDYVDLSIEELSQQWLEYNREKRQLPIKTLMYNRCPAIAPLGVLDEPSQERIGLSIETIIKNFEIFNSVKNKFAEKMLTVLERLDTAQKVSLNSKSTDVDEMLYDSFINDQDKKQIVVVRTATVDDLTNMSVNFKDQRLNLLLPLYKARNYKRSLNSDEVEIWEKFRFRKLLGGNENSRMNRFFIELENLNQKSNLTQEQRYIIEELKLYAESIVPAIDY